MSDKIRTIKELMSRPLEELRPDVEKIDRALKDRMLAAESIITKGKNMCKLDDCDVDGKVTGAIIGKFFQFEKTYTNKNKSHDLLPETAMDIVEKGFDVFVAVDCCSGCAEIKTLIKHGIKVVVIDHHKYDDEALAMYDGVGAVIVNPNLNKDNDTSCAVVLWKMLTFLGYTDTVSTGSNWSLEDWVAVSAHADNADMTNPDNIYFIRCLYEQTKDLFIKSFKNYGSMKNIIGFKLIPMINAAIRNGRPQMVESVIMPESQYIAKSMMEALKKEKIVHDNTVERVLQSCEGKTKIGKNMVLVVIDPIYSAYAGLVAGKLASKYKKAVFAIYDNGDHFKGSARTANHLEQSDFADIPGVTVVGHERAFGVSIEKNKETLKALQNLEGTPKECKAALRIQSDDNGLYRMIIESGKINEYLGSDDSIEIEIVITEDCTFDISQYSMVTDFTHSRGLYVLRTFNSNVKELKSGDCIKVQPIKSTNTALALIQEDV